VSSPSGQIRNNGVYASSIKLSGTDANADKLDNDKSSRLLRIHELVDENYKKIANASSVKVSNDVTVIKSIQEIAHLLEEKFLLHDQEWMVNCIAALIVRDLKKWGLPEHKAKYTYDALSIYGDKYIKKVDHSSIRTVDYSTKHLEQFHRENANYLAHLLDEFDRHFDPAILSREESQSIAEKIMDVKDKAVNLCDSHKIPVCEDIQKDSFQRSSEDESNRILHIDKPNPATPMQTAKEIKHWIEIWLPNILDKLEEYPVLNKDRDHRIAYALKAFRFSFEPVTDDKYKKMFPVWIEIVQHSTEWFRHSASTRFKVLDSKGFWRSLTCKQIRKRQQSMLEICKEFMNAIPPLFELMNWYSESKEPYLAEFSNRMSPKLSNQSLG
jgi:hypothetical protein